MVASNAYPRCVFVVRPFHRLADLPDANAPLEGKSARPTRRETRGIEAEPAFVLAQLRRFSASLVEVEVRQVVRG